MKKAFTLFYFFIIFFLVSCNTVEPKLFINDLIIDLYVNDIYAPDVYVDGSGHYEIVYSVDDPDILSVDEGVFIALKEGDATVTVSVAEHPEITAKKILVSVQEMRTPSINIGGPTIVVEEAEIKLVPYLTGLSGTVLWESSDENIASVNNGIITGVAEGIATITASCGGYSATQTITVRRKLRPSVTLDGPSSVSLTAEITLIAYLTDLNGEITWESSNPAAATVNNGVVKGLALGETTITATCGMYTDSLKIEVTNDNKAPEFMFLPAYQKKTILNWNKEFNPLQDITAIDDVDGDVTSKIKIVKGFDNKEYGLQIISLSVEDSAGNIGTMTREIEVVWDYGVTFIGHAGSYYGLMNSEEAFLYAVQVLKYQAVECDLAQTSDGVFVLSHDATFGGYTIASTPWSVLKNVVKTEGRKQGYPSQNGSVTGSPYTTGICTLERYLQICKEYNAKAVIELKSSKGITNSDQSRMGVLMEAIEEAGMRENVIFLASNYNCLIWTRNNGYGDIPCQYLVNSIENNIYLQRCIDYDLDISTNVTYGGSNSDEWLEKYFNAGRKISVYTFTQYVDYAEVQVWINKGVHFVTCDWHLMGNLNLPEKNQPL